MTTALRLVGTGEPTGPDEIAAYVAWGRDLRGLRPTTLRVRQEVLTRLLEWLGRPLTTATETDLLRWEAQHVAGKAPETRRAYVSHVRAFYGWVVKVGAVDSDPTGGLTLPKMTRGLPRPLPEADLRAVVDQASPKLRLMVLLGAFCGLRCQEIAGLHWSDLSTDGGQTTLLVRDGKGGKERVVPVPAAVLEAMLAYGRRRSGPMFFGLDARQVTPGAVSTAINRLLRRAGVRGTAHQLRHRFGTTAYRLTTDLRMVQELMGHSSPQTTARYAAYDVTRTGDMVRAMDAQWNSEPRSTFSI